VSETRILPATADDLEVMRDIEHLSGQRYRDYGLDRVADDEPMSAEELSGYADAGRAWVAVGEAGDAIGFILVDDIDGAAHIEQVSVVPDRQGRGIGRALIEQVASWAVANGIDALTLTTFGHIPWNRPLYEHIGFRVLDDGEIGPGLRALRTREAEHGLDPELRVAMRKHVPVD
jgi:GNAT superfamily N-acetyltransferase